MSHDADSPPSLAPATQGRWGRLSKIATRANCGPRGSRLAVTHGKSPLPTEDVFVYSPPHFGGVSSRDRRCPHSCLRTVSSPTNSQQRVFTVWSQAAAQRAIIVAGCLGMIYLQLTTSPATIQFAR